MAIVLSEDDIRSVREVSARLLSILSEESVETWAHDVMSAIAPLVGADRVFVHVPEAGGVTFYGSDVALDDAIAAYTSHYFAQDVLHQRRRVRGGRIFTMQELLQPEEYEDTEIWNDWCVGYGICDAAGVVIDLDRVPIPCGFTVYHERPTGTGFHDRGRAILELLAPSVEAAVRLAADVLPAQRQLCEGLDALSVPGVIADGTGRVVHLNRAFLQRFEGTAAQRSVLASVELLARRTAAGAPVVGEPPVRVPTGGSIIHELSAMPLPGAAQRARNLMLVLVRQLGNELPGHDELQRRFGLTRRQAEVATLLAQRRSDKEIAAQLEISFATARGHAEAVLTRLGVSSRRAVRAVLAGDDALRAD